MKVVLDFNKTVDENASEYFAKAKKSRKKLSGAKKVIEDFKTKHEKVDKIKIEIKDKIKKLSSEKKLWFDKFKWFVSSDNYLIIAGRDATTNEIVIKKHTDKGDLVFHTDMAGSPFAVIKKNSKDIKLINEKLNIPTGEIPKKTIEETASFIAMHAKAWKLGLTDVRVFYVNPDQVSKEANSGEYMQKGSFMIRGKTKYVNFDFEFGVGILGNFVMCSPLTAVQTHCGVVVQILQGKEKTSAVAKKIRSLFREKEEKDVPLDDIIKVLPAGGCEIKKERIRKY